MSDSRKIHDLRGIDVDHGMGETAGGFVGVRCYSENGDVSYGQISPDLARQLAADLAASAARAEYEEDLYGELKRLGSPDAGMAAIMVAVRKGEARRHETTGRESAE